MTRTIDADDLDAASAAGILSDAQARDLSAFLDSRRGPDSPSGEEELRFIRNFHDVFLSIGLVMLGIGLAALVLQALASVLASVLPGMTLTGGIFGVALALMIAFGLITGLPPAINAHRVRIVDAIGKRPVIDQPLGR